MNDTTGQIENRAAPRFKCRCHAEVGLQNENWSAHLINISQSGALIAILDEHILNVADVIELCISQETQDDLFLMGSVVHTLKHYVGVAFDDIRTEDHYRLNEIIRSLEQLD